ncbi:MAG: hypothetical protein LUG66_09200 [Clostridiales bacterium]|nr:hypothetical protein [Clostridiales bacterium]
MKKNILSVVTAITAAAVMTCNAFAYAPSAYDGKSYESVGYTSTDPDGEINLAVIANSDVYIGGDGSSMYILGSIYSNGNIYVNNGGGNDVDGLLISGTEGTLDSGYTIVADRECSGYIHFADDGSVTNAWSTTLEYEGYINDDNTSFECSYTDYTVPSISNAVEEATANQWSTVLTVSEDTYYKKLNASGAGLIIDATNNDVTIVIDALYADSNPEILTVGSNKVNIYINDFYKNGTLTGDMNFAVVSQDVYNSAYFERFYNITDVEEAKDYFKTFGDPTNTNVYINSSTDSVVFTGGAICGNIYSNADSLTIAGSAEVLGNIYSGASTFTITGGGTFVEGTVCVPNADSQVIDSGTLIGQLHTNTIHMNGAGSIYYQADLGGVTAIEESTTEATTEGATETTTIDTETVYGVLGAKVIWYNVDRDTLSDGYELGRIKLVGHTPDGEGHDNTEGISNSDLHYTVLDESTYYHTDEQLTETDWNEAVRRVTKIYEISQKYLDSNTSGENAIEVPTVFGRIDSNGYKSSLTVTPYAQAEIKSEAGSNMYVCIADGTGNITDVLMIIDESVQYEDDYDGLISPYVYNFTSNGYMTYASILEQYKDSFDY